MLSVKSTVDFTDAAAVRQLAGSDDRLVCLYFPDGMRLYSHKAPLALASGVLSNVLEDTQQQLDKEQFVTVPVDDTNTDAWQAALRFVHHVEPWEVTFDNAQGLLLLAHKYDIPSITAQVHAFLACFTSGSSRLAQHLTPAIVTGWLAAASRCGLNDQVKICIEYIVDKNVGINYNLIVSLDRADANQLLAELRSVAACVKPLQARASKADACRQLVADAARLGRMQYAYKCGRGHNRLMHYRFPAGLRCPECDSKSTADGKDHLNLQVLQRDLQ